MFATEDGKWWVVSIIDTRTKKTIRKDVDAVFAGNAYEAHEKAGQRNPRRSHEVFGLIRATVWKERKAAAINMERTSQIEEFEAMMAE